VCARTGRRTAAGRAPTHTRRRARRAPRPSWLGSNLLRTASIPPGLSSLTALRKLWLPSNHLVELPEAICDLPAIEWM
jgi:Leucine-rich repeat (LRR) protein